MADYELLPTTQAEAQAAALAFAGIVGGGIVAYEASRAIRDGDIFKTDAYPPNYEVGTVAMIGGFGMFAMMVKEAVAEVGWKPLLAGSAGIAGLVFVVRAARR